VRSGGGKRVRQTRGDERESTRRPRFPLITN
jgi:hypothetical protein